MEQKKKLANKGYVSDQVTAVSSWSSSFTEEHRETMQNMPLRYPKLEILSFQLYQPFTERHCQGTFTAQHFQCALLTGKMRENFAQSLTCLLRKPAEWRGMGMVSSKQIQTGHRQSLLCLLAIKLDSKCQYIYHLSKKMREGRETTLVYKRKLHVKEDSNIILKEHFLL